MNNNVLEFYIKMRDMMSGGLVALARTSQQKLGEVKRQIETVVKSNNDLTASFQSVERSAERSGNSMMSWGRKLSAAIGVAAVLAGTVSFAKSSIQESLQNDMHRQSFGVLTGNRAMGDALAGDLQKLARDSILGPEVFAGAQTMLGFGVGVEEVMPAMKMLGDVSMGNTERLKSLVLAFSQVRAAGRLTGQDLLQFVNAGFNPLMEVSKMTGRSMAQLKKDMEEGKISYDMVYRAMERATKAGGTFHGMLDKMGGTTGGKIQQVTGQVQALKIAVGEQLKPMVDAAVTSFGKFVDSLRKMVEVPVAVKVNEQIEQIKVLQNELTASNTTHERRVQLLKELEQINPSIVEGINAEAIEYGKLATNINKVVFALNNKKLAAEIEDENVGTITRYNRAVEQQQEHLKEISKMVSKVPGLAERNDLTAGQKQQAAFEYYRQASRAGMDQMKAGAPGGEGQLKVIGAGLLSVQLYEQIKAANEQAAIINRLNAPVAEIKQRINNAQKAYSQLFGINEMQATAKRVSPAKITPGSAGAGSSAGSASANDTGRQLAASGPRTIHIHGVNMKVADNISLQVDNAQDFVNQLEPQMKEMLLRLLNSGSAVQG